MMARRRHKPEELLPPAVRIPVSVAFLIIIAVPVGYMLLTSLNKGIDIATANSVKPSHWILNNYVDMWTTVDLASGLVNSIIIAGISSVVAVILATFAAYVLSRFAFRGRRAYLYSLIALQSAPQVLFLLPLFIMFAWFQTGLHIKLIGTYPGPIITYLTFGLPLATWLMVSYLGSIPKDIEEAALVDGATRFRTLISIIMPLAVPGMAVALAFSFLLGWNDVLFASVLTSDKTRTLAVDLQAFSVAQQGGAVPLYGQLMAAAVVSAIPVVVLYLVLQRYMVGGLAAGGTKG